MEKKRGEKSVVKKKRSVLSFQGSNLLFVWSVTPQAKEIYVEIPVIDITLYLPKSIELPKQRTHTYTKYFVYKKVQYVKYD